MIGWFVPAGLALPGTLYPTSFTRLAMLHYRYLSDDSKLALTTAPLHASLLSVDSEFGGGPSFVQLFARAAIQGSSPERGVQDTEQELRT